jgi:hypothetical protein
MWVCHSFFYVNDMPMLAKKKTTTKQQNLSASGGLPS